MVAVCQGVYGCGGGAWCVRGGGGVRRLAMSSFHTRGHRPGVVMGFLRGALFGYL